MMPRLILVVLLLSAVFLNAHAEEKTEPNQNVKLKRAIVLLRQTTAGAEELKNAEALGIPVESGPVSKTDITATRSGTNSDNPQEENLHFVTRVTIAADKEPVFQALDLAHELTHATHAKSNPFDPKLNVVNYIESGIEGEGGEANAIAKECAVGKELSFSASASGLNNDTLQLIKARCQFVWNTVENPTAWKKSFYFLGQYYREFMKSAQNLNDATSTKGEWLRQIQAKSPVFFSAVAHKPYPLALLEEYVAITHKVCDRAKAKVLSRTVASAETSGLAASVDSVIANSILKDSPLKDRCAAVEYGVSP
jgi:hypothetical protein